MAAANNKPVRVRNAVHDAAIWRQTVNYELNTAANWERYWGFMKDAMIENENRIKEARLAKDGKRSLLPPITSTTTPAAILAAKEKAPFASGLPSKLPSGIVLSNDDPIMSDFLVTYRVPEIIRVRMPMEKYRVPCTTSAEVGWVWGRSREPAVPFSRDSVQENEAKKTKFHTLERFPREAYGKGDVLKWWGGTRESMP